MRKVWYDESVSRLWKMEELYGNTGLSIDNRMYVMSKKMRSRQTKETAAVAYEAGNWGLGFGAEGTQPTGNATSAELAQYDAHYVGDPSGKVLYLTFDCG